jgi:hypothetical protein
MTGGTDGTFTADDLRKVLDGFLPSDCYNILLLTPLTSSIAGAVMDYLEEADVPPYLFWVPAPTYTSPASTWVQNMETALPERSNFIVSVIGSAWENIEGRSVERYAAEAALIGYAIEEGLNATNVPVPATHFTPILSENDLNLVKSAGFMALMRYIRNDVATYEGVNTAADQSFLFCSKYAEVVSIARDICLPYIGQILPQGRAEFVERRLRERLRAVRFLELDRVRVTVKGAVMLVEVDAILPGEILSIKFVVKTR